MKPKVIHSRGKAIRAMDKVLHAYLENKMWNHTGCGYLFDNTPENRARITFSQSEVTCKLCLKIMNQ